MSQGALLRRGSGRRAISGRSAHFVTPSDFVTSFPMALWHRADLDVVTDGSGAVNTWGDESGNGWHLTQLTSSRQAILTAVDATLNNQSTIASDGVDDYLESAIARIATGTTPWTFSVVLKQITWPSSGKAIFADVTTQKFILNQNTASPQIGQVGTATVNLNNGLAVGSWGRLESVFAAGANSYLKLKANKVQSGASEGGGGTGGTGMRVFGNSIASFSKVAIAEIIGWEGLVPPAELSALDTGYFTPRYGAGLT